MIYDSTSAGSDASARVEGIEHAGLAGKTGGLRGANHAVVAISFTGEVAQTGHYPYCPAKSLSSLSGPFIHPHHYRRAGIKNARVTSLCRMTSVPWSKLLFSVSDHHDSQAALRRPLQRITGGATKSSRAD